MKMNDDNGHDHTDCSAEVLQDQRRNVAPAVGDLNRAKPETKTKEPAPASPAKKPGRRARLAAALAVLAIAAGYGGYCWLDHALAFVETDNAYVVGHVHQISSRLAANVTEIPVADNQVVHAGDVLAKFDAREFEVRVEQAKAQLSQAESAIAQADAQITQCRAAHEKTQADFARVRQLIAENPKATSAQEYDAAKAAAESAEANWQAAQAARTVAVAARNTAKASLADAELQLSFTVVTAPATGRIGKKSAEPGNRVAPGQPLMALVADEIWVVANFKETEVGRMSVGQPVELKVDAFPKQKLHGHVESFSPASGAQFALLPPDNATGNFTKIVQRLPVKILLDDESARELGARLAPGMSVIAEVNVRSKSGAAKVMGWISPVRQHASK